MDATRPSLLDRVRDRQHGNAWTEFARLYGPLLARYARRRGLSSDDAEDVTQECLKKLLGVMETFLYQRDRGSFKAYLHTMVVRAVQKRSRRRPPRQAGTVELEALTAREATSDPDWDRAWLQQHLTYCLARLESRFAESTITAFKLYALKEWPVERVCEALNVAPNQVYTAKSRVTSRLRQELTALIGDVW